jgi:hypothetical protein
MHFHPATVLAFLAFLSAGSDFGQESLSPWDRQERRLQWPYQQRLTFLVTRASKVKARPDWGSAAKALRQATRFVTHRDGHRFHPPP